MATSSKPTNPYEAENRRHQQREIEKALTAAQEAEKARDARNLAEAQKAREAAKQEKPTQAEAPRPETNYRNMNFGEALDRYKETTKQANIKANESASIERGQEMAGKIKEARDLLAQKHKELDPKGSATASKPGAEVPSSVKESEHAKLLEQKNLSAKDRAQITEAAKLDLDARTVEAKMGRKAETFAESKNAPEPVETAKPTVSHKPKEAVAHNQPHKPAAPKAETHAPKEPKAVVEPVAKAPTERDYKEVPALAALAAGTSTVRTNDIAPKAYSPSDRAVAHVNIIDGKERIGEASSRPVAHVSVENGREGVIQQPRAEPIMATTLMPASASERTVASVEIGKDGKVSDGRPTPLESRNEAPLARDAVEVQASPVRQAVAVGHDLPPIGSNQVAAHLKEADVSPKAYATPVEGNQKLEVRDLPPLDAKDSISGKKGLDGSTQPYASPKEVDNKLMQSAHPKEADLKSNVLGQEAPTAQATPRFDQSTYARALDYVQGQKQAEASPQEKTAETQQRQAGEAGDSAKKAEAQRENVREMEMGS